MKKTIINLHKSALAAALTAVLLPQGAAAADADTEQRLESIEERLAYTEQRLKSQDDAIVSKADDLGMTLGGVIEVEATSSEGDQDVSVATVELGIGADIADGVSGEIVLLYEGEDLEVDTAIITLAPQGSAASFTAGKFVVPFGTFETNLVSDPLTLELAETGNDGVLQADFAAGVAGISVFAFNGEGADDELDTYGVNVGVALEDAGLNLNLGFINDLSQSGLLIDGGFGGEEVAGTALSVNYQRGAFTLIAEYVAINDVLSDGTEPSATNLEAAYGTLLGGKPATFALGYQTTDEAENLDLPETRVAAAFSVGIMENTGLGFEYAQDTSYTDEDTDTFTAKLSVEF